MVPRLFVRSVLAAAVLILCVSFGFGAQSAAAQTIDHLGRSRALSQVGTGPKALVDKLSRGQRSAISLAAGDFFEDGANGLVTGYVFENGGVIAVQQGATLPRNEDTAAAFLATSKFIDVGTRPDFLKSADLNGDGHQDLIVAARGGRSLALLLGDGKGGFAVQAAIPVRGSISAVTTLSSARGEQLIAVGVCGSGCSVDLYRGDGTQYASIPVEDDPTIMEVGRVNRSAAEDLVVGGASRLFLIDGRTLSSSAPRVDRLPISGAVAVATGWFVYDRRNFMQIAVLTNDGSVHTLARTGLVPTPPSLVEKAVYRAANPVRIHPQTKPVSVDPSTLGWSEAETLSGVVSLGSTRPLMVRSRLSGSGMDDLLILNANGGRMTSIGHPVTSLPPEAGQTMGEARVLPARIDTESTATGEVQAVLPMRVSQDARWGIVTAESDAQPNVAKLTAYHTYNVGTTLDGAPSASVCVSGATSASCTLRDAFAAANADLTYNEAHGTADTINIPAGTFTLSYQSGPDQYGDATYHIEVEGPVNVLGAAASSTVITTSNKDQIFAVNSDDVVNQSVFDSYFSGLTLTNGTNPNNPQGGNSLGLGGLFYGDTDSNGYITIVSCNFTNGTALYGEGGAIAVTDGLDTGTYGAGTLEIDGGTIGGSSTTLNKTSENGGGLSTVTDNGQLPILLNGVTITYNEALHSLNSSDTFGYGRGGGIEFEVDTSSGVESRIINSTISSNQASPSSANTQTSTGGGLDARVGLLLTNNIFKGNTSTYEGGGIYIYGIQYAPNLTGNTVTGNTSSDGGGILLDDEQVDDALAATAQYNRIVGNTATANPTRNGLGVGSVYNNDASTAVTANYNFWGCNGAATGTGCDTAASVKGTITLTPYAAVSAVLNTTTPTAGTTLTLTGGITKDSTGTALSNLNAFTGVAGISTYTTSGYTSTSPGGTVSATLTITPSGSNATTSTVATSTAATSTLSITPTTTGPGTATVKIDNATVSLTFTVLAPDLNVTSTHTGNFKAGDTADTYTLTAANIGTASTSGTVTVADTLPSGFTATAISGTGWTCTLSSLACTRSDALSASVTYPAITLTVSVSGTDAGNYTNSVTVSGGGEVNTNNDTGTDATIVVGAPTISEAFNPTTVAPNVNSTVTFTLGNPSANTVSLTGVSFSDTLPTGLKVSTPSGMATTCTSGTVTATAGSSSITLAGATIAAGATCTVTVNVVSPSISNYLNTTGNVTATNSNAGLTASATLMVTVTPTRLVYTAVPPSPITAGGNAGTLMVALEDAAGNVATNNSSTVVTLTVTGPGSYSQPYSPVTATNGVTTFNLSSVPLTVAGTYTYTASATGLTSAAPTEIVIAGAAATFTVTGLSTFTAPQMSGTAIVVARDSYGNVATSFTNTVTLSSSDTMAAFAPASYTYTASDASSHGFTVTFNTAGTQTVTATSGSLTGSETGILVEDSILVLNSNGTLTRTTDAGVQTTAFGSASGTAATYGAAAFDNAGDIWTVTNSTSAVQEFTEAGVGVSVAGSSAAGVSAPVSLFIDGQGQVWVANTNNSVSVLSNAGAAVSPGTGYQGGGLSTPSGILVDSAGAVWVSNRGNNSVTKIFGAAAPVVTPTVTGTTNNTLGTRP